MNVKDTWTQIVAEMQDVITTVNKANGWFDDSRTFGEDIVLLHSEVSEMLEEFREHGLDDYVDPDKPTKPLGVGSEVADVFIRLLDTCERYGIDLVSELLRKMEYNATREYKHGGKAL